MIQLKDNQYFSNKNAIHVIRHGSGQILYIQIPIFDQDEFIMIDIILNLLHAAYYIISIWVILLFFYESHYLLLELSNPIMELLIDPIASLYWCEETRPILKYYYN